MEREELLKAKTHKDDGLETSRRVFYTLQGEPDMQLHRVTKLLSLLIEQLQASGHLSEAEIDTMLLELVR